MARRTNKTRRLGILPGLAMLFALAAGLRLVAGFDAALARDPETPMAETTPAVNDVAIDAAPPPPTTTVADPAGLLLDVHRRETALAQRAAEVDQRLAVIEATETRVREQIIALQEAEAELEATMALADRAAEDDITRLVGVFEAMESEQAAAVFAEMEPRFAAGFLGRLAPQVAAEILAGLEPRQAYTLSALLAGRNALVPHE